MIEKEAQIYKKALERIADPIKFLRIEAEAEGGKLNGQMAIALSEDHNWLKQIARDALNRVSGNVS